MVGLHRGAGAVEGPAQHRRQLARRVVAGAEGLHHQPALDVAPQPRHQARTHQRRLAGAGGAEHHHQAGLAQPVDLVEQVQAVADLLVAAEEDAGVLLLEGQQPRIGRAAAVPVEGVGGIEPGGQDSAPQALERLLFLHREVDDLAVGEHPVDRAVVDLDRKEVLAEGAGVGDLHEAPARRHRVPAAQHDDGAAGAQLAVELLLPVASRRDARLGIEIEEDRTMALRGETLLHVGGDGGVFAGVADEDGAHGGRARS